MVWGLNNTGFWKNGLEGRGRGHGFQLSGLWFEGVLSPKPCVSHPAPSMNACLHSSSPELV